MVNTETYSRYSSLNAKKYVFRLLNNVTNLQNLCKIIQICSVKSKISCIVGGAQQESRVYVQLYCSADFKAGHTNGLLAASQLPKINSNNLFIQLFQRVSQCIELFDDYVIFIRQEINMVHLSGQPNSNFRNSVSGTSCCYSFSLICRWKVNILFYDLKIIIIFFKSAPPIRQHQMVGIFP